MNFFHWRRLLRSDWILLERFSSLKSSHHPSMFGNMWFLIDQLHRNSIQITRCCKLLTPMISPYLLSRSTFLCTSLFTLRSFNWGFLVLLVQEICPFRKANSRVTISINPPYNRVDFFLRKVVSKLAEEVDQNVLGDSSLFVSIYRSECSMGWKVRASLEIAQERLNTEDQVEFVLDDIGQSAFDFVFECVETPNTGVGPSLDGKT